jgi:type I restriction enzyme M protein
MLYSLNKNGKGAIVVPTGFITGKTSIKKKILQKIVDDHIVYGVVQMPSKIFATTGTNVSVLFFDKSCTQDKVVLIDASKMGYEEKDGNNIRTFLASQEIDTIVETFLKKEAKEDFSVVVTHDEIKKKGYSLSAGQYFDVKIEYEPITDEEYKSRISSFKQNLTKLFNSAHDLETKIISTTDKIVKA